MQCNLNCLVFWECNALHGGTGRQAGLAVLAGGGSPLGGVVLCVQGRTAAGCLCLPACLIWTPSHYLNPLQSAPAAASCLPASQPTRTADPPACLLSCPLVHPQADIAAERDAVLSDLPSTCFFATFKSQQAAAIASQTNLNPIMQRLFNVQPAPRPDDVNWSALQRSWWQRTVGGAV